MKNRKQYIVDRVFETTTKCWVWKLYCTPFGYGTLSYDGKKVLAHRHSYEVFNGEIPDGIKVLHKCDNPSCVNPEHLFLGTQKDNIDDMVSKSRNVPQTEQPKMRGEDHPHSKLTKKEVKEIRNKYMPYKYSYAKLGIEYNVSESTIREIVYGNNWSYE